MEVMVLIKPFPVNRFYSLEREFFVKIFMMSYS